MKKIILPVLILGVISFSGCKWFGDKSDKKKGKKVASIQNLQTELQDLAKQVADKTAERNKNTTIASIQNEIQEKARVANAKIKEIVEQDAVLKELNDEIVKCRREISNKDLHSDAKKEIYEKATNLVKKFKEHKTYKVEIEPLETNIKELTQKYQSVASEYNTEIQKLLSKKDILLKQLRELQAQNQPAAQKA